MDLNADSISFFERGAQMRSRSWSPTVGASVFSSFDRTPKRPLYVSKASSVVGEYAPSCLPSSRISRRNNFKQFGDRKEEEAIIKTNMNKFK